MNIRKTIIQALADVVEEFSSIPLPDDVTDKTQLDELWLDSIAFLTLITNLEEQLKIMPPAVIQGEFHPETVGDFITAYTETIQEKT